MSDDTFIWTGLFLFANAPFILALILRYWFPNVRYRLVCHVLSVLLLGYLAIVYFLAERAYRNAGNQDDGGSSMAAFLLLAGCVVIIPENLMLHLPLFRKKERG
ncbi:hypothetical protein OH491_24450 [Termitidicoccus mucosus]|uniref:hypothetical protein n=1 Tax=Termitidicoccus mucosus TaxID=1184151 RepID=UPI0011AB58E8